MFDRLRGAICSLLLALCLLTATAPAQATQCGDCDVSGLSPTILDALRAAQISAALVTPGSLELCACDVDAGGSITVLDALLIAQAAAGLGAMLICPQGATCGLTPISGCRVVDSLGATASGPTGIVPAYAPLGAGAPPSTGDIADANPHAANYWDFDYFGLNQGEFNGTVQLTDASGANVGNPVILHSAGHDYRPIDVDPVAPCNPVDTFQLVLEATVDSVLQDLSGPTTSVGSATITTSWASSDPGIVGVSPAGLLTATGENGCATIDWTLSTGSASIMIDPTCASGSIAVCVDSGGVDVPTRGVWLPVGDVDGNLAGLPTGRPRPAVGGMTGFTWIVNTGSSGLGAYAAGVEYDEAIIAANQAVDMRSIGGSTQSALGPVNAVAVMTGRTRWNDVDAFATHSGVFDIASQTFTVAGSGTTMVRYTNEELANGFACTIWVTNPCMPFNSITCGPIPAGGYPTIAGSADVSVP